MTYMTADGDDRVVIHKSDGVTRRAQKVQVLDNNALAVWDTEEASVDIDEPDVIVKGDKWERIEKEEHSWRQSSASRIMQEARERDDVDEEFVSDVL